MRLVLNLLRRRREILRFEITETFLSVMGELSNSTNLFKLCRYSLSNFFRKQSEILCEIAWITRTCQPLATRPGRPPSRHNRYRNDSANFCIVQTFWYGASYLLATRLLPAPWPTSSTPWGIRKAEFWQKKTPRIQFKVCWYWDNVSLRLIATCLFRSPISSWWTMRQFSRFADREKKFVYCLHMFHRMLAFVSGA